MDKYLDMREYDFACGVAYAAHAGQVRKYTGDSYINHPISVCSILIKHGIDHYSDRAVAMLHDVVEDTDVKLDMIRQWFTPEVSSAVYWLTDFDYPSGSKPNRAKRKAADRSRLSRAPGWVQSIKVADLIDNTSSIVEHDPKFAKVYLAEKQMLLDVLVRADLGLRETAYKQIVSGLEKIGAI